MSPFTVPIVLLQENANLGDVMPICQNIVNNPWLIIGGAATSVCRPNEIIM